MIITNHKKGRKGRSRSWLLIAGLAFFLILLLLSKTKEAPKEETGSIHAPVFCSAETVKDGIFVNNGIAFGSAEGQSKGHPHSGKYSCKLTEKNRFGLVYTTTDFKKGWRYKASVWRYTESSKGFLTVAGNEGSNFKITERIAVEEKDGFERLQITFSIPETAKLDTLKIFAGVDKKTGSVYFDDLEVEILDRKAPNADFNPDLIHIEVSRKAYNKLNAKRWQAHKEGLLFSGDEDRVKGTLTSLKEHKKIPVKLRLKGDWTDHLSGDKWSFRIKALKEGAWNRMRTFSIQHPKTRGYLKEWLFHRLLHKEDLLAPRFDFVEVEFNEKKLGIYAYEEHFDKQLPESQERREGPILKLTENLFWLGMKRQFAIGDRHHGLYKNGENAFEGSDIRPFKEGKTQASPALSAEFKEAQKLLYQFKYRLRPAREIFDVDRMAKYIVIMDVLGAYHGHFWHNLRFYYNPVSARLEPIGFDGFGEVDTPLSDQIVLGYKVAGAYPEEDIVRMLFRDADFFRAYMKHLNTISSQEYLQDFFTSIQPDVDARVQFLHKEFPKYTFSVQPFLTRAKNIHLLIEPFGKQSVIARVQEKRDRRAHLKVSNVHAFPVEILGYGDRAEEMDKQFASPVFIPSNPPHDIPQYTDVEVAADAKYLFFSVAGLEKTYATDIVNWAIPEGLTTRQVLFSDTLKSNTNYEVTDNKILFHQGMYIVTKDIIIPKGYKVFIEAGTGIDLQQSAAFISQSPVFILGTEEKPVRIFSSDESGNGFTVLQAGEESSVDHCQFDNLNTLGKDGWQLSGAVTFFESDVHIAHSSVTNNHCEDALNIVHSNFDIRKSVFANTFADGFDADFCKGTVDEVVFRKTGNDAMDFSGSVITIQSAEIFDAGDKGLSVGEKATVHAKKLQIIGADTGVASKDLSRLTIDYIHLEDCVKGFAAYQKKPEYGKAVIFVKDYFAKNVKFLHVLDTGSTLNLKGEKITE